MKYLYLLLLVPFAAFGQHNCLTVSPKGAEKQALESEVRQAVHLRSQMRTTNSGTTCIPIKVHDVLDGSGGGAVSRTSLNVAIANLNFYFKTAGIEFYLCGISTIDNATYYDFASSNETSLKTAEPPVTNAFNMYLVNSITDAAGYAYFPNNSVTSTTSFIDKHYLAGAPNGTVVHEFGHHFNLYHTHEDTENGNTDPGAENVPRSGTNSNCTSKGDLLCDTHADPRGNTSSCVYTDGATDINGVVYTPPLDNIMSYYPDNCGGVPFTSGQYARITAALTTRLGHTAYSLNCTPATVTAASGLAATWNGNQVDLTWADNANNELGYLIERSETSSSTGFVSVAGGGVADGVTSFSDVTLESYKTYYYRVKASNGSCNNYSNVATVSVGVIYCLPNYSQACQNATLSAFSLVGNTTINNTDAACPGDGYTNYTSIYSADVTAGSTYNVTATKSASYTRYIQIYGDFNRDGDFDDAGETLLASPSTLNFSGSITIPVSAYNGKSTIRVVMANNTGITACGDYSFGETEDYAVNVSGGLTSGISDLTAAEKTLKMVPNPSSGKTELQVWSDESTGGTIRIISMQGNVQQTIEQSFQYGDNSIELDLSGLQSGVYMIETIAGKTSKVAKLLKY